MTKTYEVMAATASPAPTTPVPSGRVCRACMAIRVTCRLIRMLRPAGRGDRTPGPRPGGRPSAPRSAGPAATGQERRVPHDAVDRPDPVTPADLLALVVGAPGVGDPDLVDAATRPAATLAVISGSMPNRFSSSSSAVEDLAPEHLVTGLHVGEVQVGEHVRDHGEEPVADRVPEVEDPVGPARRGTANRTRRRPGRRAAARGGRRTRRGRTRGRRPARSRRAGWPGRSRCGGRRPCPG